MWHSGIVLSDARVVRRVLRGSREDFSILVQRYLPTVRAIAFSRLCNKAEAEDAAQDCFLQAFQNLNGLRQAGKFGGWLATITRNRCARLGRARQREIAALAKAPKPEPMVPDPAGEEMRALVRGQLARLDENEREILLMHYFAGKTTGDIAVLLDISRPTAKKRLERARQTFSAEFLAHLKSDFATDKPIEQRGREIMAVIMAARTPWLIPATAGTGAGLSTFAALLGKKTLAAAVSVAVLGAIGTGSLLLPKHSTLEIAVADANVRHDAVQAAPVQPAVPAPKPAAQAAPQQQQAPDVTATPPQSNPQGAQGKILSKADVEKTLEQKVSIQFENIRIQDIVEFFSESYKINMLVDDQVVAPDNGFRSGGGGFGIGSGGGFGAGGGGGGVRGEQSPAPASPANAYVTDGMVAHVDFSEVPLGVALSAFLRRLGLTYSIEPGYFWISTAETIQADPRQPRTRYEAYDMDSAVNQPVSMEFDHVPLKEICQFISDSYHVNIAIDSRVVAPTKPRAVGGLSPKYVTDGIVDFIDVKNLELRDALTALLRQVNLAYRAEEGFVFISSPRRLQQINFWVPQMLAALTGTEANSIEFKKVPLDSVLATIGENGHPQFMNVFVDNEAVAPADAESPANYPCDGRVGSIQLKHLPLGTILAALLRPRGLDFAVSDGALWVSTPQRIARGRFEPNDFRVAAKKQ